MATNRKKIKVGDLSLPTNLFW